MSTNINIDNNLTLGNVRLVADPVEFKNADGSRNIKITVASEDNYKSTTADGSKVNLTNFFELQHFVRKGDSAGILTTIHKGDKVSIMAHPEAKPYVNAEGQTVYPPIKLMIDTIKHQESKTKTSERLAERVAKGETVSYLSDAAPVDQTDEPVDANVIARVTKRVAR